MGGKFNGFERWQNNLLVEFQLREIFPIPNIILNKSVLIRSKHSLANILQACLISHLGDQIKKVSKSMILWTGNRPGKKNYVIVYIMFSKNNIIEFETF